MLVQLETRHLSGLYFLLDVSEERSGLYLMSQDYLDPDLLDTLVISYFQTIELNLPFGL